MALNETIRLMREIDEVIEKHGGWPGAFAGGEAESGAATEDRVAARLVRPFRGEPAPPPGMIPVLALSIAAGGFSSDEGEVQPEGWISAQKRGDPGSLFAAYVHGKSMEPTIPDGALCLFRRNPSGSREGRVVLARDRRITDPENGGAYTVKRYHRLTPTAEGESREGVVLQLKPDNPAFEPIELKGLQEGDVPIAAEFLEVLALPR